MTTAPSAAIISWTCASSARQISSHRPMRSALWRGACATMHSTSTASRAGSRRVKCARSIIVNGTSKSRCSRLFTLFTKRYAYETDQVRKLSAHHHRLLLRAAVARTRDMRRTTYAPVPCRYRDSDFTTTLACLLVSVYFLMTMFLSCACTIDQC